MAATHLRCLTHGSLLHTHQADASYNVSLMTLDPDDLPRGVIGLQQAVNQLGREELLQQLGYSSILDTKKNCKSSRYCQGPFVVKGPLLSKALSWQRPFLVNGPLLSKVLCCQRPFVANHPFLSKALCCQRPFLVKGPLLSQALCCQRPFVLKDSFLSRVKAKWQR